MQVWLLSNSVEVLDRILEPGALLICIRRIDISCTDLY